MRRVVVGLLAVPLLLATAACSGSTSSPPIKVATLTAVQVTGPTTKTPLVDFKAPIAFGRTASKIVAPGPGTGPAVAKTSLVTVQYVGIDATDESVFGSSWKSKPSTFYVNSVVPAFTDGLIGKHAGDRVLIGAPAKDAFGVTGNLASSVHPGDSVIFVVDIVNVAETKALPADVPTLTYDANGDPSKFTSDSQTLKAPTKLGVYPIVEGPGPVVKSGDNIAVEYFGQIYPDGTVFNGWTGQSFPTQIGTGKVIPGWDQAIVGQRVGTRMVLVVPPALGYKNKKQGDIPANSTLIFTVQIVSVN